MNEAREILHEVLSERQSANPSYSMRAFARDLQVSPQQLSNVISGRRGFSPETAVRIARDLKLDSRRQELFLQSLKARFAYSKTDRVIAQAKLMELESKSRTRQLEVDLFNAISSWHHLALLGLIGTSAATPFRPARLARRLGISELELMLALGRLERLGLISRDAGGWKAHQDSVVFDRALPTDAIRRFHQQLLEKAVQALGSQTAGERYGSSSTIPIRVRSLEHARELIQKFRAEFDEEISDRRAPEEVYGLTIQFYRLTQPETKPL